MSHVDPAERAALVKNKKAVFWGATLVAAAIIISIAAANFASNAGSGQSAAQGVYWQGTVGEADEVAIHLPPRSWWDLDIDKPVIIRLVDGQRFMRLPNGLIAEIKADGRAGARVTTVGDVIPGGVIYLLAVKGGKMVKVSVTVVRKAPAEIKPAPKPPTATTVPPPSSVMPMPPARPSSPKGGMV